MKNLFLLNRSGMSPEVTCRKGRHAIESIVSRFSLVSLICLFMLTIGSGNAWGATYTITLKSNSSATDGSTARTALADIVSDGTDYVSSVSGCSRVYNGKSGYGIKFGASRYAGYCTLNMSTAGQKKPTKITFNAARYGTDGTNLSYKINGGSAQTVTLSSGTTLDNYEVSMDGNTTLTSLYVGSASKRIYLKSITITYTDATPTHTLSSAVSPTGTGSVTFSETTVAEGSTATATATPNDGYRFSSWSISGTGASLSSTSTNPTTVTMGTANATVTANFVSKGCTDHGASSITGGALSDDDHGPVHAYYDYSTSQFLYTKSDLDLAAGKKGTIKSIYFEYSGAAAMAARTIKIYMANTDLSSLTTSNYVPYASFTQVYSGTFSCGSAGWYEITLDTPFDYDGIGNLVVMVDDNTNSYQDDKNFKYHSATGKQIYKRQDDTDIDPASWTPASAIDYRPNTKFCIQEADMTPATVTLMDNGATITEASAGAGVTLPSRAGCSGYTFAGWTKTWVEEQSSWTTTAPTIIPAGSYTPTADENLYPVYTKTESGGGPSNDYELYSGSITEGDYIIYYNGYAMNTTVTSDRLQYEEVTPDDDVITTTDESIIWHVAASGDYWTIYNANADAYAASTGAKNKAQMLADGTDDKSLWTVSGTSTYEFVNKQNTANSVNANLRNNGTYGFACYATSTGGALSLYKNAGGGSTTYYISVPNCCTDWSTPTVSYSSSLAINASEAVTISSGTTHGAVTYESSDEDVLTVDADGTIHAVGAGTAHIIATWAGDATYCEKSANSNDVTVSGIQVTGTTPVNFGQVYQNAAVANKTIYVTGLGLASPITPSLPVGSPFSFSPASLAKDCSGATLTISASTATLGTYNQTLTLTSGAFSATVTVKMEVIAKPTATFTDALHELTTDKNGASLNSFNLEAAQGTPVVFPTLANQTKSAGTCEGEYYIFAGWTEGDNNTDPQDHLVTSHTLANGDAKHYYAVWADASGSVTYTKLTSNSFSTSAHYVIGAESGGTDYFLYSCEKTDANNSWGLVSSDPATDAPIQFTLSGTASALVAASTEATTRYLKAASGKQFFGMSSSSTTVVLGSGGTIESTADTYNNLRYNSAGGLRWYTGPTTGDAAYFYEVGSSGTVHYRTSCCANKVDAPVVTATTVTSTSITLTWPADVKATGWEVSWNGGAFGAPSGTCTHTVSGLTPNTTYTWKVRATYNAPQCGADTRSGSTTTNQVYHVTYAKGSGTGSCTASGSTTDETGYEAGATVTLQTNDFTLSGNTFAAWTTDDPDVVISSNQFTMPDHDVVITATWTAKADKYFDRMHDQTDASHGGVAETEGTNEGKYYILKEGCSYSVPTAVDSKTGDACQTSHYKLRGWIAASYVNSKGEITDESKIFSPGTTKTAGGYTYYAVWAEVVE